VASIRQSVRGAPIVVGLTPYTLLGPIDFEGTLRTDFPPDIDSDRLERYGEYLALIENRPFDVFSDLQLKGEQRSKIVIALALPELICNVWADSVWGDAPKIEWKSDAANDRWERFAQENDIEQAGWESVFAAAFRGTSVLKLHRDENRAYEQVRLDEIPASLFFPSLKPGSDREFESVVLAWEEDRANPGDTRVDLWQVRELHVLEGGRYVIHYEERKRGSTTKGGWRRVAEKGFSDTGLDFVPFVDLHGARWSGRYWGMSELARITSIIDEIDNRLSDIAEVLEYHGKPILQVPKSLLVGNTFLKGADRTVAISDPALADVTKYITYDAMPDSQIAALDKLVSLALLTCEIPSTYFGEGVEGGAPSGTALKLRLQNYLKKAARWQRRETQRLRTLGEYVMRIDGDGVSSDQARESKVTHGSPLPADDEQEARIENLLSGNAVLTSRETSITRLRRVEDVEEELAKIDGEQQATGAAAPTAPAGLEGAGITVEGTDADQGPQAAQEPPQPPVA
jgi:hypothetical protein